MKDFAHEWDDTHEAMFDDIDSLSKAAAEVDAQNIEADAQNMEKPTVRQAIRLKPSGLEDSEQLFAKPVAEGKPGQREYPLHGGEVFPEDTMNTAVSSRVDSTSDSSEVESTRRARTSIRVSHSYGSACRWS